MGDDGREELDDLDVAEPREIQRRAREEEVAREDRQLVAVHRVERLHAAAHLAVVHHVVVQQRRGVDHLRNLGQTLLPLRDLPNGRASLRPARANPMSVKYSFR